MAGFYVDVPGRRMALERDGTSAFYYDTSAEVLNALNVANLNNEGFTSQNMRGGAGTTYAGVIFPELRDVVGMCASAYMSQGNLASGTLQWSVNTTNGLDGTWTAVGCTGWVVNSSKLRYRTGIEVLSLTGIKAMSIRFNTSGTGGTGSGGANGLHLYGGPSAGQNPDRLRLWHPTLDQEVVGAYYDWGDVPRSTSADRTFRVKNNSATLTANGVNLTLDAPTDTSPSVAGQQLLSPDGSTFTATLNIGNLAPGEISSVCTLRRVTPTNAVQSVWWARVKAAATTWA